MNAAPSHIPLSDRGKLWIATRREALLHRVSPERADAYAGWPTHLYQPAAARSDGPVLTGLCDEAYARRHGVLFCESAAEAGATSSLHMHLLGANESAAREFAQTLSPPARALTSLSWDTIALPASMPERAYVLTASRFVAAHSLLISLDQPLWIFDVDSLFRRPRNELLNQLEDAELGLILRPRRSKSWKRVLAASVFLGNSPAARGFSGIVHRVIAAALTAGTPSYHIDQLVLWYVACIYRRLWPSVRVRALDIRLADADFSQEGFVWHGKGPRKDRLTSPTLSEPPPADT